MPSPAAVQRHLVSSHCAPIGVASPQPVNRPAYSPAYSRVPLGMLAAGLMALSWLSTAAVGVQFQDLTASVGPFPNLESWGVTARDYDGDDLTDILVNNHRQRPFLLRNLGNGQFMDVTLSVDKSDLWVDRPRADMHGAGWIDLNNDGLQDLWNATGTCCDAHLQINHGGYFIDEAIAYDVHEDGGGRGINFVDFSGDDRTDAVANAFNDSRTKEYDPILGVFLNRNIQTGFDCGPRTNHIHVADFSVDGDADILCVNESRMDKLYDTSDYAAFGTPFVDISSSMPAIFQVPDSAIGDFDNNGQTDVFLLRGFLRQAGVKVFGASNERVEGQFDVSSGVVDEPFGFTFQGGEQVQVTVHSENYPLTRIKIGGPAGFSPSSNTFVLDSTDPLVQYDGTLNHDTGVGHQLYIAYNTVAATWDFIGFGKSVGSVRAYVEVANLGLTGFSNALLVSARAGDGPRAPSLLMNASGTFVDEAATRGLTNSIQCASVVAGDFDADMDLDLYAICRTAVSNEANLLYLNDGSGNFTLQAGTSGAEGPIGAAVGDGVGTADSVVTADFDGDGFLDLYAVNGLNLQPDRVGAQSHYYRNLGNANHWIQLDLVASQSSRDAVGAKVFVTAGGVTQLREQDNGHHRWSQNSNRLHFGLAANSQVALIRVEWPSGEVNEFSSIAGSSIYRITEGAGLGGGTITPVVLGPAAPLPGPQLGDECGEPAYDYDFDPVLLVWKDCGANTFHVRAKGARLTTKTQYAGRVLGSTALASVTPIGLTGDDTADTSEPSAVEFDLNVRFSDDSGFDLDAAGQTSLCLELDIPAGDYFLVGQQRWAATGPLDLLTMGPCGASLGITDLSVDEDAGVATVTVSLSEPASGSSVFVDYATADGTATAGLDYTATNGTAEILVGQSSTTFDVPLLDDSLVEGDETVLLSLNNAQGAVLGQANATLTLLDDEGTVCGEPSYDKATEIGLFLWRDCEAAGPDALWQVRITGGGGPTITYGGVISADMTLSALGVSIEGNDTLDSTPGDGVVDYSLIVGGAGFDGFGLTVPAGAEACFGAETLPAGANVYVGAARQVLTAPFSLATLGPCAADVSITDLSVNEDAVAGVATVTVSLSEPASGSSVFVDYATADGTATAGLDYTATNGTAEILVGQSSTTFDIPLLDDSLIEGDETVLLSLSNPQGALLGQASATLTLNDDEGTVCGEPSYDKATEIGLFLWRDCEAAGPDALWQVRVTGGGGPSITYSGVISADMTLSALGVSLEGSDTLDSAPGDGVVDYSLIVGGAGFDGFGLTVPAGAETCFGAETLPAGANVYVGAARQVLTAPFSLATLGPCAADVSITDLSVDEDAVAGVATVTVSLSEPASGSSVFVDYATADGTATAGLDYTATNGTAEILVGQSSTTFDIPLLDDSLIEGDETVLLSLSNPQGALLGQASATLTLNDDEGTVCGEPSYDKATEIGLFLWRDCEAAGPDALWQVRITGGGGPTIAYGGVISADMTLSALGVSIEGNDTLDSTPGDGVVDYSLIVGGAGFDGFGLTVPAGAETCFGAETLPAGANVYVGAARQVLTAPFSLATLGPCAADVSITDLSVDEDAVAGVATVTVSLSEPASGSSVFVDYATADGTATAGLDYTATNGTAEILVGQSSTTFDVPLLDDSLIEGDETVLLSLSNPQGALLGQASATLTLNDDEGTVCGEPSYDKATEIGLFLWRDCEAVGPDAVWQVRVTGGGSVATLTYEGLAAADPVTTVLSSTGVSLEPPFDVVDSVPGDQEIDYLLKLKGSGIDGFEMIVPVGAKVCFDASTLPSGASVLVGANRQPVTAPIDLDTLQFCTL